MMIAGFSLRPSIGTFLVALMIQLLAASGCEAEDTFPAELRVLGHWRTADGNLLRIHSDASHALKGVLSEVSEEAAAIGFEAGDTALGEIEMVDDLLLARILVRPDDPDLRDCPAQFQEFRGALSGDAIRGGSPERRVCAMRARVSRG